MNMNKESNTLQEFPKKAKVTSYSGYKANERPLSFILNEEKIEVREIIDRWYGVESDYFKLLGSDGLVYILKWHRLLDVWLVVKRTQDERRSMQDKGSKMQVRDEEHEER